MKNQGKYNTKNAIPQHLKINLRKKQLVYIVKKPFYLVNGYFY